MDVADSTKDPATGYLIFRCDPQESAKSWSKLLLPTYDEDLCGKANTDVRRVRADRFDNLTI